MAVNKSVKRGFKGKLVKNDFFIRKLCIMEGLPILLLVGLS